jgi:hypothetical protein|tara:strand:- start:246 stop:635 length:390 start_codon:yes stop_codon:yes gene_type:complete
MAALNQDTRLIMTILFVGTVSGANVYFYANYGINFPYTTLAHATLFGLITVGGIMCLKAIFDLSLNDKIELRLLDRRINAYWERRARDEQQRQKLQETMKQYNTSVIAPSTTMYETENTISNDFLAKLQ